MSPKGAFGDEPAPLRPIDELTAQLRQAKADHDAAKADYQRKIDASAQYQDEHPDEDLSGGVGPPPESIERLGDEIAKLERELEVALAAQKSPSIVDLWDAHEAAEVSLQKLRIRAFNGETGLDQLITDAGANASATAAALDAGVRGTGVEVPVIAGGAPSSTTPTDPGVDTGHYDDAHAFGWGARPTSPAPSTTFGWKRPVVILPVVIVIALGLFGIASLTGGGDDDATSEAADALPTATTTAVATEALPIVDKLTIDFARPVSTYAVVAHDPGGGELTYRWTMTGESCGTPKTPWTQQGASVTWSHGDAKPDSCTHLGSDHDVDVGLLIETTSGPNDGAKLYCGLHGTEKLTVVTRTACGRA